jgi:hypothetical protein
LRCWQPVKWALAEARARLLVIDPVKTQAGHDELSLRDAEIYAG